MKLKSIGRNEAFGVANAIPMADLFTYYNKNLGVLEKEHLNPRILDEGFDAKVLEGGVNKRASIHCPFHHDNTLGSASVYPNDGDFGEGIKCYVGDCPTNTLMNPVRTHLVVRYGVAPEETQRPSQNPNFEMVLKDLCALQGYEVTYQKKRWSPAEKAERRQKEIMRRAAQIYHEAFLASEEAQSYVFDVGNLPDKEVQYKGETLHISGAKKRGLRNGVESREKVIQDLQFGYAPEPFPSTFLYDQLTKDFTTKELLQAGVVRAFKKGDKTFVNDAHSEGLVLPYYYKGEVMNLYARSLYPKTKGQRHMKLDRPIEVPVNLERALRSKEVHLNEGDFGYAAMRALGMHGALLCGGTNGLSDFAIEEMAKSNKNNPLHCQTIYVWYDGDSAGKEATYTDGKRLAEAGLTVYVVRLPDGKDPNDLLAENENASEVFQQYQEEALSFYAFQCLREIEKAEGQQPLQVVQRANAVLKEQGVESDAELRIIAQEVASATGLSADDIMSQWKPSNNNIGMERLETAKVYVFMTDNLRSFYRTEVAEPERTVLIENPENITVPQGIGIQQVILDNAMSSEKKEVLKKTFETYGVDTLYLNRFEDVVLMERQDIVENIRR